MISNGKSVMYSVGRGLLKGKLTLAGVFVLATALSTTATAQIPVLIEDTFSHDEGLFLTGTTTEIGDRVWTGPVTHIIQGERAAWRGDQNSGNVQFVAPLDSTFSVEAIHANRETRNAFNGSNPGLGFADSIGPPGSHVSSRTGLTLAIQGGGAANPAGQGQIRLYENAYTEMIVSGSFLADFGIANNETGDIHMLLEIDPVHDRAKAFIDSNLVYDIPYKVKESIYWAGFAWANTFRGEWDDFRVRAVAEGPFPPATYEWKPDGSGAWNSTSQSNWIQSAVPNSNEHTVIFGGQITSPEFVFIDSDVTAKEIEFENTNSYGVVGAGVVNLESNSGNAALTVAGGAAAGDHQFQAVVTLQDDTDADIGTGASLTFNNTLNLGNNSLMKMGGGTLTINNQVTSTGGVITGLSGAIAGSGIVGGDLNNVGGTISPGNSPGVFEIAGDYTQGADGSLLVELGGTEAGVDHDLLKVGGDVVLDGQLEVTLIDGFQPAGGAIFSFLDAGSVEGTFDLVSLPGLPEGLAWDDSGLYTDGSLRVIPEPGTLVLLTLGLLGLAGWSRRRRTSVWLTSAMSGTSMFGCVLAMVAALSTSAAAQGDANATVIADNFNRPDGDLAGSTTQIGNETWVGNYAIEDGRLTHGGDGNGWVPYTDPIDRIFSVEATVYRDPNSAAGLPVGIGFSDIFLGEPPAGPGGATGLSFAVNWFGHILLYDNGFANLLHQSEFLPDIGLPGSETNALDMKLEMDPINNRAIASMNGIEVYNVPYGPWEQITWAGVFNGRQLLPEGGADPNVGVRGWDDFAVREGTPPASPTSFEWHHDHSGEWDTASHWNPDGVPNGNNHTVIFGDSNQSQPHTVLAKTAVTVKSVQFDSPNGYAISGGTVNLESDVGNASIVVLQAATQGAHEFQAVVDLQGTTDVDVVSGATLMFNNGLNLNGQTMTKTGGGAMLINNQLNQGGGDVVVAGGLVGGSGEVGGNLTNISGTVGPGQSTGTLSVEDNYTQEAGGTLQIEIGGTVKEAEYDVLNVLGDITLNGGTLDVSLTGGFNPSDGNPFDILDFANLSGNFDDVILPAGDWDTSLLLSEGILTFGAGSIIIGDLDCDGDVDFDDIDDFVLGLTNAQAYEDQYGIPPTVKGDTDGDNDLDFDDITGFVAILSGGGGGQQAVPEPQSIMLLSLGLAGLAALQRRVRHRRRRASS